MASSPTATDSPTAPPAMVDDGGEPGELIISGGGSVIVASDELRAQAAALDRLVGELQEIRGSLAVASGRVDETWLRVSNAPTSALSADRALLHSVSLVQRCAEQAAVGSAMLQIAVTGYGVAEQFSDQLTRQLAARLGYATGLLSPLLLALALPALGMAASAAVLWFFGSGASPGEALRSLGDWAREHNEILTNSFTVALVRGAMHSADDILGGVLRFPAPLVALLGEEGAGLTGLSTTAALVALLARGGGMLRESGVGVTRATTTVTAPPQNLAERVARIPSPDAINAEQIRIERYSRAGEPDRFEVYIAGTVDFGLITDGQPWDLTSNVSGIAGLPAASVDAVRQAMDDAGIDASTPVVFTGYSQGGLVAALLAASGDYTAQGLVTFGAPLGLVEVPAEVPMLTVRHSDDLVGALGGYDSSTHALVVERELFAGREVSSAEMFPAHQLGTYLSTAELVDDAESPRLRGVLDGLDEFAGIGAAAATTVVSTGYLAVRTVAPATPPVQPLQPVPLGGSSGAGSSGSGSRSGGR